MLRCGDRTQETGIYCTVLYRTVPYCIVLYFIVLFSCLLFILDSGLVTSDRGMGGLVALGIGGRRSSVEQGG